MSNSGYTAAGGAGVESSWGTAAARSMWMRVVRSDLKMSPQPITKYALSGAGAGVPMPRLQVVDRMIAGGPIEVLAAYDDMTAFLLGQWIGSVTEGGGAGPTYTHTYKLVDPASLLVGFTWEQIKNKIGSTTYSDVAEGCVIPGGTLSIPENGPARLALDVICETIAARNTAGSPTYHTGDESLILGWHGGNLAWSNLDGKIKSLDLTVRQNLERRWLGGSQYTARPYPIGSGYEVTMRVVREHDENTVYTSHKALTQGDATITYSGPSSQSLAITLQNAQCTEYSDPTTNPGVNDQSFTLTGHTDGTDLGLSVVLTNTQALYTTN